MNGLATPTSIHHKFKSNKNSHGFNDRPEGDNKLCRDTPCARRQIAPRRRPRYIPRTEGGIPKMTFSPLEIDTPIYDLACRTFAYL